MNSVIYSLFISLALRMTVVTAFVMLIKLLLKQKLSAAAHSAIWFMLFIQSIFCLGGVNIPAKTSIYNVVSGITAAQHTAAAAGQTADWRNIAALCYAAGAVFLAMWYITVFIRHIAAVSEEEPINDAISIRILSDMRMRLGIHNDIKLRRGSYAHTLLNTVILPDGYSEEEQRQIILHELCHYKHRDNLKLWAAVIVICLNWFNPLVWIAFKMFRADIEMYCDDSVLKLTDNKKEYARVLVKTASDRIRFIPGASSAANGTHEVARRVKRIVSWNKKKPVWLVAAIFMCFAVSCLCLTDAVSVAVENKVDAAATPEPIELVPAIVDTLKETAATNAPTDEPARREETYTPHITEYGASQADSDANTAVTVDTEPQPLQKAQKTVSLPASNTPAPAQSEPTVSESAEQAVTPETETGSETVSEIYDELGTRESISANGSKEIYSLDDGRTAVLHYDDGNLERGYIISSDTEESGE